jgi:polyisoprenoid-binding protein YceI
MKFVNLTTLAALFVLPLCSAKAVETLSLDADASKIEFVGKKPDDSHAGGFKKFNAKAVADFETPANGSLAIDIDATSLWSDDEKLTNHLKNPDFFDVRKYPKITFKATQILPSDDDGKVMMKGDLTMLGKTAEINVPCTASVGDKQIEIDATFVIDRTRWGMTYGE